MKLNCFIHCDCSDRPVVEDIVASQAQGHEFKSSVGTFSSPIPPFSLAVCFHRIHPLAPPLPPKVYTILTLILHAFCYCHFLCWPYFKVIITHCHYSMFQKYVLFPKPPDLLTVSMELAIFCSSPVGSCTKYANHTHTGHIVY